jgi:hypothetical protein
MQYLISRYDFVFDLLSGLFIRFCTSSIENGFRSKK